MTTAQLVSEALTVEGLSAGYGSGTVLHDVSIQVAAGEAVALLGPNGAGKTTLLRTISGNVRVQTGSISLLGADITREASHRRFERGMCHVPEGRGVFRSLTVKENLEMQAPRGAERAQIERATESFPVLAKRLKQRAGTLSGGEQQMLAISAAYARQPQLILVDEASLGLAPKIVEEIFAFLADVKQRGTALLVVDQFVESALALADRAYLLRRGEIAFEGRADELESSAILEEYLHG